MNQSRSRPEWAERLRQEREARDWTQEDVVRAMRALAKHPLPEDLLTTYKRYERGKHFPTTYASLLAAVFGTNTEALFGRRRPARQVLASTTPPCRCGTGQAAPLVPARCPDRPVVGFARGGHRGPVLAAAAATAADAYERVEHLGVVHVVAASSGTTALQTALDAAGVWSGDEILVPALAVVMSATAVCHLDPRPVSLVDCLADNETPDGVPAARRAGMCVLLVRNGQITWHSADDVLPRLQHDLT